MLRTVTFSVREKRRRPERKSLEGTQNGRERMGTGTEETWRVQGGEMKMADGPSFPFPCAVPLPL